MVLLDEIDDRPRQTVLLGERQAVLDVADDDQRAEGRLQVVVPVLTDLVLHEVVRLEHLADVVEIAADARQQRVGSDLLRGGLGERGHRDAVRVRAWGTANELLHERMAAVGQLQHADVGDDAETALDQWQAAGQDETGQERPAEVAAGIEGHEPKRLTGEQPG